MNRSMRRLSVSCLVVTIMLMVAGHFVAAQDKLATARELYRAAAYDDALGLLDSLRGSNQRPDERAVIEQYRAFCLLALGRATEAEQAIEAVVIASPSYHPSDEDTSPRVRSVFGDVRRRILPGIIERKFAEAKAAFDRKDSGPAVAGFTRVLDLLADPDLAASVNRAPLANLRTLAVGFRDLSATNVAPPPVAPPPQPRQPPPRPAPTPRPPVEDRIYGPEDVNVVPPIVVRQTLPPVADVFALRQGIVEVIVDETGAVKEATMRLSVNPVYDRLVLTAAKRWRYTPASLDGRPVKFRKIVQIDLKPNR
jgi:hypothetical protein